MRKTMIVAGEACPPELARRWSAGRLLVNGYGPTEATIGAVMGAFDGGEIVSIGRTLPNLRSYLVDSRLRPLPIGVPGELLIGGAGLMALELLVVPATPAATLLNISSIVLLLIALGRAGFILTVDFLLQRRLARPLPLITRQIIQGLIYAGIILIALHRAGVDTTSLLTTSALLTAIIGLSLQDILGNLFAGLAIQAETPFELGD